MSRATFWVTHIFNGRVFALADHYECKRFTLFIINSYNYTFCCTQSDATFITTFSRIKSNSLMHYTFSVVFKKWDQNIVTIICLQNDTLIRIIYNSVSDAYSSHLLLLHFWAEARYYRVCRMKMTLKNNAKKCSTTMSKICVGQIWITSVISPK